jgi:hypothetical protein
MRFGLITPMRFGLITPMRFGLITPMKSAPEEHDVYSLTPSYLLRSSGAPSAAAIQFTCHS